MGEFQETGNGTLNIILALAIGTVTGAGGFMQGVTKDDLILADLILALVLKTVSIVSFFLVIILSAMKIVKMIRNKNSKDVEQNSK